LIAFAEAGMTVAPPFPSNWILNSINMRFSLFGLA
jgi:hypothetical protein